MLCVVLVRSDGSRAVMEIGGSEAEQLRSLQDAVGGYIEQVTYEPPYTILCNEHGKLKGLAPNVLATSLANRDIIVGDVVIAGPVVDGVLTGLTPQQISELL